MSVDKMYLKEVFGDKFEKWEHDCRDVMAKGETIESFETYIDFEHDLGETIMEFVVRGRLLADIFGISNSDTDAWCALGSLDRADNADNIRGRIAKKFKKII